MLPGKPNPFGSQPSSSPERFDEAKKIEVRPRAGGAPKAAENDESPETMLSFSCPACLEMLVSPKTTAHSPVQCPECSAWVMPPKVVSLAGGGKTALPPPRKTGTQALRQ